MLLAMPSPDSWNCLNVRKRRTMRSRTISRDQRSPSISSEMLTGQPDRCCVLDLPGNSEMVARVTFILQVISPSKGCCDLSAKAQGACPGSLTPQQCSGESLSVVRTDLLR